MRRAYLPGVVLLTIGFTLVSRAGAAPTCRPDGKRPEASTALVFSGGGAKAAYEAGVALGFKERGVRLGAVAGSSAGALNAALVASGQEDVLVKLWREVTNAHGYRLPRPHAPAGVFPG